MQTVHILVGVVGSGKSYLAKEIAKTGAMIINRDAIRQMLFGEYRFVEDIEPLVTTISHCAAIAALEDGRDVVFDECNITKEARKKLVAMFSDYQIMCHVLPPNRCGLMHRCYVDRRGYEPAKWRDIHDSMMERFEKPTKDEGYVEIIDYPMWGPNGEGTKAVG